MDGGKGGGSSVPMVQTDFGFDPHQMNKAQYERNLMTAGATQRLNMVNQANPYGSISYTPMEGGATINGVPLQYQSEVKLSPEQQRLLELQQAQGIGVGEIGQQHVGQVGQAIGSPLDYSGLGNVPGQGPQGRSALEDALYSRIEPSITRDRAALDAQLANQGFARGSEGWQNANRDFEQNVADTRTSVALQAGAEQDRQMAARNQAISEMLQQRSIPLNELSALMSGTQVNLPNQAAMATPQANVANQDTFNPYLSLANLNANQDALNAQLLMAQNQQDTANSQSTTGGLMGLAGSLGGAGIMSMSDRRMKRDIVKVGMTDGGLPVYTFKYIFSDVPQMGVMADEVEAVIPDAVAEIGGIKHVNYGMVV